MSAPDDRTPPRALDSAAFDALYRRLKGATSWGASDRRGALNHITPVQVMAAAREVRAGHNITLASLVETGTSLDNPEPNQHEMIHPVDSAEAATGLHFAMDRFATNVHGNADSHIDALCHVMYDGRLYNDVPVETITAAGATALTIDDLDGDGIVGRGVLLDIPRLRGVPWLEPGDDVTAGDLAAAEDAQDVRIGQGDLLFVRVGHRRRRDELGPWDVARARAGLHPTALEFLAERLVAALGSDGNNDTAPSSTEGVAFPVHVLAIQAMGLQLLDYLQFEDLAPRCEAEHRWSFLCVIAPLRLPMATGSPINPIAIL